MLGGMPGWAAESEKTEIIDGEEVRRAVPVEQASEVAHGGAIFVNHGPGFGRRIALTFDDGPNPKVTERVLAALKERGLLATFFMIGQRVAAAGEWAEAVHEAGHEIGNHSLTHPQLSKLSDARVAYELAKTQELILDATNVSPVWFRPPYGAFKRTQGELASSRGLGVMLWSVDPRDWSQPGADKITHTILTETRPGSIILCHDLHPQTADALPGILDGLLERGFEFCTISGFMGAPYGVPHAVPPGVVPAPPLAPGALPPPGEPHIHDPALHKAA